MQPVPDAQPLVVAITARALFHMEDSHGLFEARAWRLTPSTSASARTTSLAPGIAFPLVRKLLALNAGAPAEAPRVEVILLSRNSVRHRPARVQFDPAPRPGHPPRHVHLRCAGRGPTSCPFGAQLFLSANPESVRRALEAGVAAATILPARAPESPHDQLRIAFDGDAVIFGDESERVSREHGIEAFGRARTRARARALVRRSRSAASSSRCTTCRRRSRLATGRRSAPRW